MPKLTVYEQTIEHTCRWEPMIAAVVSDVDKVKLHSPRCDVWRELTCAAHHMGLKAKHAICLFLSLPLLTCLQEEYLRQYMAQVAAIQQRQAEARSGQLTPQGQQELKTLKHELAAAEGR